MSADTLARGWANVLGRDRKQFDMFFGKMMDAFAYHKIVLDKAGKPIDYVFLEVNHAFEKMTGLKRERIIGKKVTEVLVGIENDPADWIGVYGQVALTGEPVQFENHAETLGRWYNVSAYSPEKGYFVALFEDITKRKKAEQELKQAKNDWERTFDSAPDLIAILDNQYRIVRANRAMAQQLGVTPEKAVGLLCYQCVHGLDSPPDFCPHTQTLKDQKQHTVEVHEPHLGGDFLVSTTPLRDEKECVIGSVHIARNITERKKAKEALECSNQKINEILSSIQDDFYVLDRDWNFVYVSKYFTSKIGKEPEDFVGKNIWEMFPKYLGTILEENFRGGLEKRQIRRFEVGEKNTASWYRMTVFPSEEGITVLGADITEQKKAEEALKDSEQLLRFHAENTPLAVVEWDSNFVVTRWAGDAEKIFGWSAAETIGKPIMDLNMIYESDIPVVEKTMMKLTSGETKVVSSNRNITKNGNVIYCTWYNSVLVNKNGKMTSVFSFVEDNTARVIAEKTLEENNKNLEKLVAERTNQLKDSERLARYRSNSWYGRPRYS